MNLKKINMMMLFILWGSMIFSEDIIITDINGKNEVYSFSKNVESIRFDKIVCQIKTIQGMEQFLKVKKLYIGFSDLTQTDFDFLKELKSLEVLEFSFITVKDLSFLSYPPNLKAFRSIETYNIEDIDKIDIQQDRKSVV